MDTFDLVQTYPNAMCGHTSCCGMCELYDLQKGPLDALASLAAWQRGNTDVDADGEAGNFKPLVVFSDNHSKNGLALARYIVSHRLGRVVVSGRPVFNPNSHNNVQAWLWRINRPVWDKWVRTHIIFEDKA